MIWILLATILAWLLWRRWRENNRSYAELVEEYNRLDNIVAEWRYPDGGLVPQEKRMRLMQQYREAWRRVRDHPEHPSRTG